MVKTPVEITAAGGVLWRAGPEADRLEVAIVHRPRYDDWSLPKGKLLPGEPALIGAVREVTEETGSSAVVGRPLDVQRYLRHLDTGPVPKSVRFWAMQAIEGEFTGGAEVDELAWLPVPDARAAVTLDRDRATLAEFEAHPVRTVAVALIRHASAGDRDAWPGDDRERLLDADGVAAAAALSPLLACYRPTRALSADVLRCIDTLAPYANERGLPIESEPLLSESGYDANPAAAFDRAVQILTSGEPTAVCSQGGVLPDLLSGLCRHFGRPVPPDPHLAKGWLWVLHMAGAELVDLERHGPFE